MHDDIELQHDEQHRWCLDCHDADGPRLAPPGERRADPVRGVVPALRPVPRREAAGLEGRRARAPHRQLERPQEYLLCAHCHNPHQPRFRPLAPKPAPRPAAAAGGRDGRPSMTRDPSDATRPVAPRVRLRARRRPRRASSSPACGPKRLVGDAEGAAARSRSRSSSGSTPRRYGTEVTVADTPALPGVLFAYALDISRCIGCRRCVYACVEENNQSRDPQIHWIRVLAMEKEKGVDFAHADPYYDPPGGPGGGPLLRAGRLPAVREPALHEGLPDRRHLEGAGRHRRHRLRLVHRLPLLHGRLPLRGAALQLGGADRSRRPSSTRRPTTSATGRARRASSRSAPSASSARGRAATRPASRSARSARASSATSSTRRARSATSSSTSGSSS